MRKRKPEKLKSSIVKWISKTPGNWNERRGKFIFKKMERPVRDEDKIITVFRDGVVTLRENRRTEGFTNSVKEIGYQGIRKGDLVIHEMDGFAGAIGISDSNGKSTPVYTVLNPHKSNDVENRYYSYLLRNMALTGYIESLAKGIRQRSTDFRYNDFAKEVYPVPPKSEQKAIAAFLDRKTEAIDQLIEKKQQLIEKLKEKQQALITRAVTKGLSPDVPMKDSGIEWLGEIPEGWSLGKLKWSISTSSGSSISSSEINNEFSVPVYGGNGFIGYTNRSNQSKKKIIVGRVGALCGNVHITSEISWVTDNALIIDVRQQFKLDYLYYLLIAMNLNQYSTSTAQPLITSSKLKDIYVPIPPLNEQLDISHLIREKTDELNILKELVIQQIQKLKEYRQSLISAAVTGKIDVRDEVEALSE